MGIKFLDTINKELNEIQENKNQISKEISELRTTIGDLHTEKNSLKENMKITDKLKVMGLSKKIRETEQEIEDLKEILETLNSKTIDIPEEEVKII
jgi:peptidoglycan hydrolase CwlO-like protein